MIALFAYGSLIDTDYQKKLFGESLTMREAVLMDYRLGQIAEYPTIWPLSNFHVKGKILLLNPRQLMVADDWEGSEYFRFKCQVVDTKSKCLTSCLTYQTHSMPVDWIEKFVVSADEKKRFLQGQN